VDNSLADEICCYNRDYAESKGYWKKTSSFLTDTQTNRDNGETINFFDSVQGILAFYAPVGRTWDDWVTESTNHGWPSFRDDEVNWDYVRCLDDGETVTLDGIHLGHNLPDDDGNRYCINLVSIEYFCSVNGKPFTLGIHKC